MKTVLVRTGKFRPDAVERSGIMPDAILSLDRRPAGLARAQRREGRRRPDRDRADPARARALSGLPRALLHRGRARVLRLAPEPGRELRGPLRRQGGGRQGARLRRRARSPGRRSRSSAGPKPACALGPRRARGRSGSARGAIDLSMTHSRELAAAVCVVDDADVRAALHRRRDARGRGRATTSTS